MNNMHHKFLFVTDTHNKHERDNPKGRIDNYHYSILLKQEEIGGLIDTLKPDTLLFGGDLFDRFDAPMSLVNDVVNIWKNYHVSNIIGVVGSHDYNGYQIKTLRRTGLGNFVAHNLMTIVGNGQDMFPKEFTSRSIRSSDPEFFSITGTPHSYYLADKPDNFFTATDVNDKKFTIQLVHGDLFYKSVMWKHQLIESIHPFVHADIVLCGHIHCGWEKPIIVANDKSFTGRTLYVNPGSIGRTENGVQRPIRVFEFDIDVNNVVTECKLTYKYHNLSNVQPHPFVEKTNVLEGSPQTDFTTLMRMISNLDIQPTNFKTHIPDIVKELYGDAEDNALVIDNVINLLEKQK